MNFLSGYKRRPISDVRRADAEHDAKMEVVAKRGGKTPQQLRWMSKDQKDEFFDEHGDHAQESEK